jgi:NO-binding membrane sensor protein with MHYT domain
MSRGGSVHHTAYAASYDPLFLIASIVLSFIGSFSALISGMRITATDGLARLRWTFASGLSLGGGAIWSMHFMGMIAYHIDHDVRYNLAVTGASLLIAVTSSLIGLSIVAVDPDSVPRLGAGGVIAGTGVIAMHYTGMAAMLTGGPITYDHTLVAASVAIAIAAALAALWIAFRVHTTRSVLTAAAVMTVAVCGMHYTGMAATRVATNTAPVAGGTDPVILGFAVCVIGFLVLSVVIVAALGGVADPGPFELAAPSPPGTQHRPTHTGGIPSHASRSRRR